MPASPSGLANETLILLGCEGGRVHLAGLEAIFPWSGEGDWQPNEWPLPEAHFLAFSCDLVDVFGQETIENVSIAIEAHSNLSDSQDHLRGESYNWLLAPLSLHVSDKELADLLRIKGWHGEQGSISVSRGNLRLETSDGVVTAILRELDDPGASGPTDGSPRRYFIITSFEDCTWVAFTLETKLDRIGAQTTLYADPGTELGAWDWTQGPQGASALATWNVDAKLTFEFGGAPCD